jgi:5-formyltetrahydrofolate cyclo-ligase
VDKNGLRKLLLQQRQALPTELWQQKSLQLCTHLKTSGLFSQAKTILAYFSFRQEPDLACLLSTEKTWGFPRCTDNGLSWHTWSLNAPLLPGAYGIPEPQPDAPILVPDEVDLILVPAIACDARGYRLGYGGGFYDRMFSSNAWANKSTVGILFEFARVPQLPQDTWDKPLKNICTEAGLFSVNA